MKNLDRVTNKIFTLEEISNQLAVWRFQEKKIVFTNGVFDLLHLGHIDYLSQAKDQGNILIVGVNSDKSAKRLNKGKNRPITNQESRSTIMASLQFVDAVVLFDEDTPYELIKVVQPDVLVKGSDYKTEDIVGFDIVSTKGGKVATIDFLEGYSTTSIVDKINRDI